MPGSTRRADRDAASANRSRTDPANNGVLPASQCSEAGSPWTTYHPAGCRSLLVGDVANSVITVHTPFIPVHTPFAHPSSHSAPTHFLHSRGGMAGGQWWCVHNDPCGICCVVVTYSLVSLAAAIAPRCRCASAHPVALALAHARSCALRTTWWCMRCSHRGSARRPMGTWFSSASSAFPSSRCSRTCAQ